MQLSNLKYLILSLLISASTELYADGGLYVFPKGAKAEGMGRTGLLNIDTWASYNNQASLAYINDVNVAVNYENKFLMEQMGTSAGVIALPALTGTFGLNIAHMGVVDYGETRIGVGYGKKLAERLSLGVQFNYHLMNFASGYPNFYTFTGEIGFIAEPFDNVFLGAHVFNPTFAKLNSRYEDPVPVIFKIGAGYITDKLALVAEIEKERLDKLKPKFGLDYSIIKSLSLRTGVSFQPVEMCFGVGWLIKTIKLDFAFSHHEVLGYSPQVGLSYSFGKLKFK